MQSLHEIVHQAEQNYTTGTTKLGKYVDWSMYETVETITAYLNSKHTTGATDNLGREKPFFNIVTAAVNIWYRATDLDRKDIVIRSDKSRNTALAFMATILLQEWMKRERFGVFLNQWGRTLAQYGSAVVKFVERDGRLIPSVVPWNRLIVDPVDFDGLPHIEKVYKTPAQLIDMATEGHPDYAGFDMEAVKSLIDAKQARENLDGTKKDNQNEFIEYYEVHGMLSREVYRRAKGLDVRDDDEHVYFQQMHVLSFVMEGGGKRRDFTLYSGREDRDPYLKTDLIAEDGRTLAIGAVEYLFDAQWMQNHTIKQWKDQMDITSLMIFQTADPAFVGRNALASLETGDILTYDAKHGPLTKVDNVGHDITNLKAFADQWKVMANELVATPDALRGATPPSGTPYSTTALLAQQSFSLFEVMTENKGLAIEDMLREFVIPHLKTKMDTADEISSLLSDRDIQKLDAMYVPKEAIRRYNARAKEAIISGQPAQPFNQTEEEGAVRRDLSVLGNQRSFVPSDISDQTWADALKDLEWQVDVGVTNEQQDKQVVYTTLSTVLQTIATNPMVLQDPNGRMIFNKILEYTGLVSPVELSTTAAAPVPPTVAGALPLEQLAAQQK